MGTKRKSDEVAALRLAVQRAIAERQASVRTLSGLPAPKLAKAS